MTFFSWDHCLFHPQWKEIMFHFRHERLAGSFSQTPFVPELLELSSQTKYRFVNFRVPHFIGSPSLYESYTESFLKLLACSGRVAPECLQVYVYALTKKSFGGNFIIPNKQLIISNSKSNDFFTLLRTVARLKSQQIHHRCSF